MKIGSLSVIIEVHYTLYSTWPIQYHLTSNVQNKS